jgi:hypothetical protein
VLIDFDIRSESEIVQKPAESAHEDWKSALTDRENVRLTIVGDFLEKVIDIVLKIRLTI